MMSEGRATVAVGLMRLCSRMKRIHNCLSESQRGTEPTKQQVNVCTKLAGNNNLVMLPKQRSTSMCPLGVSGRIDARGSSLREQQPPALSNEDQVQLQLQ